MNGKVSQFDETLPLVLIIDDAPEVHALLRSRLATEEICFVEAATGEEGLSLAQYRSPAMILLDIDLPGLNGFEVLKALKDDARTHTIPVIILSAECTPESKVRAFDLGAVDFVTKPFEFTELRVRVRSALRVHQLVQMLAQKAQIDGLTGLWNRMFFDRRWAEEHSRNQRQGHALSVALLGVGAAVGGALVLGAVTPYRLSDVLFESVSALSTTGLSTGITPALPDAAHLALIVLMFIGRVGPVTAGTALVLRTTDRRYRYPEGRPLIG